MAIRLPHTTWQSLLNPGRYSPNLLGLLAIILTVVAWVIAANVANHLFLAGYPTADWTRLFSEIVAIAAIKIFRSLEVEQ